jgi:hypothetical protein
VVVVPVLGFGCEVVVGGTVEGTTVVEGTTCVCVGGTVVGAAVAVDAGFFGFGLAWWRVTRWRR